MRFATMFLAGALATTLFGSGIWMLAGPLDWFAATPILWRTGVPNAHLIRDVGWTYAGVATLIAAGIVAPGQRAQGWGMACAWLGGHAVIHLGEAAAGLCTPADLAREAPMVLGPPILLAALLFVQRGGHGGGRA